MYTNTSKDDLSRRISTIARKTGIVAGGTLAALAALQTGHAALASQTVEPIGNPDVSAIVPGDTQETAVRTIRNVTGSFAWNQDVSADNATLSRIFYQASKVLCDSEQGISLAAGSAFESTESQELAIAEIALTGDIANPSTISVAEYEEKAPAQTILGCTCAGNPADGLASANASFELNALIDNAQPVEGANAITFICSDGYEVTLPLSYVTQRYSIIVTSVNGDDASDAVGCSNQLWLGATAARSFARNIVEIRITAEKDTPAMPSFAGNANQPNVGVVGSRA